MAVKKRIEVLFNVVLLHLLGVAVVIIVVINSTFLFGWSIKYDHLEEMVGLSASNIHKNYMQLLDYLQFPWIKNLHMSDFKSSAHGLEHMQEVKHLFMFDFSVAIVLSIIAALIFYRINKQNEWWMYYRPFKVSYVIPVITSGVILMNFNNFFIMFHEVFFRNNYWVFDPDLDPVINILTDNFFLSCFMVGLIYLEIYFLIINLVIKKQLNFRK